MPELSIIKPPWIMFAETYKTVNPTGTSSRTLWGCWRIGWKAREAGKRHCPYDANATAPVNKGRWVATGERAMAKYWLAGWTACNKVKCGTAVLEGDPLDWSAVAAKLPKWSKPRSSLFNRK